MHKSTIYFLTSLVLSLYLGLYIGFISYIFLPIRIFFLDFPSIIALFSLIFLLASLRSAKNDPWISKIGGRKILLLLFIIVNAFAVTSFPKDLSFKLCKNSFLKLSQKSTYREQGYNLLPQLACFIVVEDYGQNQKGNFFIKFGDFPSFVDTVSYGLMYRQSKQSTKFDESIDLSQESSIPQITPYGSAGFQEEEIENGWYWFSVSNDW